MSSIVDSAAAIKNAIDTGIAPSYGTPAKRIKQLVESYFRIKNEFISEISPPEGLLTSSRPPEIYQSGSGSSEEYYHSDDLHAISDEIGILLSVWSSKNSRGSRLSPRPRRVFLSHGRDAAWREIQEFVERTLEIPTLELAQEANRGRTIFQKLIDESDNCGYAVIVMTGDDFTLDEQVRARENVIHEIGYFQGKYGADRVCLLHENEVNIPTNIQGVVYIPFPKNGIAAALGGLTRELKHL
ncbi:DNA-binding protein [Deinococcus sp. KSM4-11]|uniref:TIR domain-containing protein n=1 Tax=Deinococcus sp. KSM4-11 TaxID=2568654 RepID=UPI0010A57ABB|nr:nucleotide-binding protein [Deinococcus sp. KSM4-11]THF84853.1 DNA-binding protein [Deinococcus sp. KSM4-11]